MQCQKCSAVNSDDARFCATCGAPLTPPLQQTPVAPSVQQPAAPRVSQTSGATSPMTQPSAPSMSQASQNIAAASVAPKKRNPGLLAAIILVVAVCVIVGVILSLKRHKADDAPNNKALTEASTEAPDSTVVTETDPTTEEPMDGTAELDFSGFYGEWVDQGGRYDLYIAGNGVFCLAAPEGSCVGTVMPSGETYLLKAEDAPAVFRNAEVALLTDDDTPSIRLTAGTTEVILDFVHIPEKSDQFDWFVIDFASNLVDRFAAYDECRTDHSDYSEELILISNYPLRDLKLLSLEFVDSSQDGNETFKTTEIYSQAVLMNRHPLVMDISVAGDLPSRGISFVDPDGVTHYYDIYFSGEDGSVCYSEFTPLG